MRKYYKYYFERLATLHKQILHTPDDTAFYFIKDRFDLEAFDNAIKSAGHVPALLLENYFYDGQDGQSRNYFKFMSGRFDIVARADIGDDSSIDAAQTLCESIAEDILAKMREDLESGGTIEFAPGDVSPKVFCLFQNIKVDPIGPMSTNYYGVSVGFNWKTPFQGKSNPDNWNQ